MAPGRDRVRLPPAGLGQRILNKLGKMTLSKVLYCHNVYVFFTRTAKVYLSQK